MKINEKISTIENFILWFWSDDKERKRPLKALEDYVKILEDDEDKNTEREFGTLNLKEMKVLKELIGMTTTKCFYCGKEIKGNDKFSIFNKPDRLICDSVICLAQATDEV